MAHLRTGAALIAILLLGAATPLLLAEAPAVAPATATPSRQQIYDAAQTAFDRDDWPAAITGLSSIVLPAKDGSMSHSQGVIHARLARAYAHQGQSEAAAREANLALRGLAADDDLERLHMWLALGNGQRFELANAQAIESYGKALDAAQHVNNTSIIAAVEIGLAQCYMTLDPAKARALLDTVLATPADPSIKDAKALRAQLLDLRGRASLNLGLANEAKTDLGEALKLSGGMDGSQVSLLQITIRGDAALRALLAGDEDAARKYLAYTGAGHLISNEWTRGMGDPPVCSEAADIRAEDSVVVEFSIAADGHVIGAAPIYASRPGMLGLSFAQAVQQWNWNPERITTLPSFWRSLVRIEMRCISRPSPKQLADPFRRQTLAWLSAIPLSAADLEPLRRKYVAPDDPRLDHEDLAAVPALLARLPIEAAPKRVESIAQHLDAALTKAGAPAAARALALQLRPSTVEHSRWSAEQVRASASNLATMEKIDPHSAATAWLALEYAISLEANGRFNDARPVLERVLAFAPDVLVEHDPLRDVATLHLAALARRSGDAAGADAAVASAGITPAQCLLFDVRPVPTNTKVSSADFPIEALRWGFDGYVRESFDIGADGRVEKVRTIIAYPPFVFRVAAEKSVAHFRYLAPVVDGSATGCAGHSINLNYSHEH